MKQVSRHITLLIMIALLPSSCGKQDEFQDSPASTAAQSEPTLQKLWQGIHTAKKDSPLNLRATRIALEFDQDRFILTYPSLNKAKVEGKYLSTEQKIILSVEKSDVTWFARKGQSIVFNYEFLARELYIYNEDLELSLRLDKSQPGKNQDSDTTNLLESDAPVLGRFTCVDAINTWQLDLDSNQNYALKISAPYAKSFFTTKGTYKWLDKNSRRKKARIDFSYENETYSLVLDAKASSYSLKVLSSSSDKAKLLPCHKVST